MRPHKEGDEHFPFPRLRKFPIELLRENWNENPPPPKKKILGGEGGGESEGRRGISVSFSPLLSPFTSLFCSRPKFLDELTRERLLYRLSCARVFFFFAVDMRNPMSFDILDMILFQLKKAKKEVKSMKID